MDNGHSLKRGEADFLVIGAGIAGAAAGYGLRAHGRVLLLEQEATPGYHTTGRSAAFFAETYGNAAVRRLTTASREFFLKPPQGFAPGPLVGERGALYIARADQRESLAKLYRERRAALPTVEAVDAAFVHARVPGLKPDYVSAGVWDPECRDIDVSAIHHGFLRGMRQSGGRVITGARVVALSYAQGRWSAVTEDGRRFSAPVVINAAGAWGDEVAGLAGVAPVGLVAKRRTIVVFKAPPALAQNGWPLVLDADDRFYFKPEAGGKILATPGDATPLPPQDVQPDLEDVATAVARVEAATTFTVSRIAAKWAGLRTFAPDDTPVVGAAPGVPGFFWFVGQGGYGIQTAPAMSALVASLVLTGEVPPALAAHGVTAELYAPARLNG